MSESDLGGLFIHGLLSFFLPPLGDLSWGRMKARLASSFVVFWSEVAAPPGGWRSGRPFPGERELSTLLHGFAAGTEDVWHVWVLHAEGGTRIGLSCPFGQVRSVWTSTDRVVRGVGPLLELTTAAAVRLPREALFSFSTAAILHASVNKMPLSAFIRWTFYSSIHLGQSLL